MLKLSSRPPLLFSDSLLKHSHLWDPQSHSFIQGNNEMQNIPAFDCLAKCPPLFAAHTHTHVRKFLSSPERVNNPTPVLSDTCFTALSQSGERGELCAGMK